MTILVRIFSLVLVLGIPLGAGDPGERMYQKAILPSGAPMRAALGTGPALPGTSFACASCHLRSGLGAADEGAFTPAIHAPRLFQPAYRTFPRVAAADRQGMGLTNPPARPAYTDATLAQAIRTGIDPSGRVLNAQMPRYQLDDPDMALLIAYLRTLSASPSPGVDGTTLRFATVIDGAAPEAEREAMLKPLRDYVAFHNKLPQGFGHRMYRTPVGRAIIQDHRAFTLSVWVLSGPPATWPAQLEARYREEPVFALLGGLSHGAWAPVHAFCEANRIPCLLPITDQPVVAPDDWYTLYFSKGPWQEGEAAARYLGQGLAAAPEAKVIQVLQGETGQALAAGFQEAWRALGRAPVPTFTVPDPLPRGFLQDLLERQAPAAALLWVGPEALEGVPPGAGRVVSATALKERLLALPEPLRSTLLITYPYRAPQDEAKLLGNTVTSLADQPEQARIASRMYSLVQILTKGFMQLEGGYYRDHLLDRIGLLEDQVLPDFERLSFGPGQRYLSGGCYLMQLTPGPNPKWVKKSDWIVY